MRRARPGKRLSAILNSTIAFACLTVGMAGSGWAADEPIVCKMAVIAPEGTSWSDFGDRVRDEIARRTGGRVKLVWYYGGVMGDEKDEIKKIRFGQLQGGGFTLVGLGIIAPEVKVLEMPFLFSDYAEKDYILERMAPTFQAIFREKGFVVLGWVEIGFVQLFSTEEIRNLEDFRKTKMWVWGGDRIVHDVFTSLGFRSLIPLQLPDVLQSLQVGMLESFYSPYYPALTLQWHTHARSMTHGTFSYTPAAMLVTTRFFDSLPDELKPAFLEPWREGIPKLTKMIRKDEIQAFEGMKAQGTRVIEFPPEDMAYMHAKAREFWDRCAGEAFPRELLDQALALKKEYRSKQAAAPDSGSGPTAGEKEGGKP